MEINCGLENYIKLFENVIPEETSKNLLRICKESEHFKEAEVGGRNPVVNKNIRKTFNWGLQNTSAKTLTEAHWTNFLHFIFNDAIRRYGQAININVTYQVNDIQILKYNVGGYYKFHVDHAEDLPRTFSCILFLNDNYEGGDLIFRFPNFDREYKINKKKNSVIVWPSNFLFPHSVTPVTKGERYSVVSWAR
tara:strand:+ start:972 stop:1550 length:579 start_codon:yes stop_codon:yes gene_type:complete